MAAPAAFPQIQPMKAAFYFDSVVGFGEWRILISTRADSNLREASRKKPKLFAIILKKLKYACAASGYGMCASLMVCTGSCRTAISRMITRRDSLVRTTRFRCLRRR